MYHWFRRENVPSASRSPQLEMTAALFDRQMALLHRAGYRAVSLGRALGLDGDAALGRRALVLTFDDGTLDFWDQAKPVLDKHGFTATLFVVSGHVGGRSTWDLDLGEPDRPLLSWDQLRELHRAGFEIGSHTHTHRPLTELSDGDVRSELDRSRRVLEEQLGVAPRFVAYPRGLYDERHKRLARESGYAGACAVILRWRDLWRSDRYELKRMTVKGVESMLRFRLRLGLCRLVRYADDGPPARGRRPA
jgi:peptidoglycan/xylan/chitin deacetylase (PgdA/CDA1 family)